MTVEQKIISTKEAESQLKLLGCAEIGPVRKHPCGYGQWWQTGNGKPFFVQWLGPDGPVNPYTFSRPIAHMHRANIA
jgi:hypothetical protein